MMGLVVVKNGFVRCEKGEVPFSVCVECPFFVKVVGSNAIECRGW